MKYTVWIIRDIAFKFYCDNQSAALLQRTRRFLSSTYRPRYGLLKNFCARFTSLHLACLATNLNAISRIFIAMMFLCTFFTGIRDGVCSGDGGDLLKSEHSQAQPAEPWRGTDAERSNASIFKELKDYFKHTWSKIERLGRVDQENEVFKNRIVEVESANAKLTLQLLACYELDRALQLKKTAKKEGGIETARTISSLEAENEEIMLHPPKEIFHAALKAFSSQDYETSAKAFVKLIENSENAAFQKAPIFYLTGVSLYKVRNYKKAKEQFEQVLQLSKEKELSFAPRALSWIALCFDKLGDFNARKKTVENLIQKYPRSKEAQKLNRWRLSDKGNKDA